MNKNTLHSFSHGLLNFRECPTRVYTAIGHHVLLAKGNQILGLVNETNANEEKTICFS